MPLQTTLSSEIHKILTNSPSDFTLYLGRILNCACFALYCSRDTWNFNKPFIVIMQCFTYPMIIIPAGIIHSNLIGTSADLMQIEKMHCQYVLTRTENARRDGIMVETKFCTICSAAVLNIYHNIHQPTQLFTNRYVNGSQRTVLSKLVPLYLGHFFLVKLNVRPDWFRPLVIQGLLRSLQVTTLACFLSDLQ